MLEEKPDLPVDWSWKTLAGVIEDAQPGFASGAKGVKGGIRHLRMNNISADCRLNLDSILTVPRELAKPRHLLQHNDVLVCHTNSVKLVGKTAIFDINDGPYAFSNHLTRLRVNPSIIDPHWLWHVLSTLWRERYFENRCKQWVNQATIERETLLSVPVPLPPLTEQHRLIEKIEGLFAEGRRTREALAQVPALLKRFRQAVLAKAFRGELTERDPNDEPIKKVLHISHTKGIPTTKKRAGRLWGSGTVPALTEEEQGSLPETWAWVKVKDLNLDPNEAVQVGPMSMHSKDFDDSGIPVFNVGCVQWGYFDETKLNYLAEEKAKEFDRYRIQAGDVLFTRSGTVGRSAVAQSKHTGWLMTFHLLRVRTTPELCLPEYLQMVFQGAPHIRRQTIDASIGTTRAGFNTNLLAMLDIPLPPLDEQQHIVAKIESLFAQAEAIEQAVAVAQKRVDKVDQAILAKAFRGELVKAREAAAVETAVVIPSPTCSLLDLRHALAVYIINAMYKMKTFGRTQLQKAFYLAEAWVGFLLQGNYLRAQYGPFDDEMISQIQNTAQKAGWFSEHKRTESKGYYYVPGPAIGEQLQIANSVLSTRKEKLDLLLKLFRKLDSKKAEMVATLYAAWNDFLLDGMEPTDEQIIKEVRENWHQEKQKLSPDQLKKMLAWMRQYKLTPTGTGPHTHKQK